MQIRKLSKKTYQVISVKDTQDLLKKLGIGSIFCRISATTLIYQMNDQSFVQPRRKKNLEYNEKTLI
jgi:hypothetical protein